jgi:succinylglutamate desuccinylase
MYILMNKPIIIESNQPGPTVVILGGVHGNETCGVEALKALQNITIDSGTLILIYGNPQAIEQNVRYVEQNLNRMFCDDERLTSELKRSYEYQRSREILPYLHAADYSLDLHASFTPDSEPFIICESNSLALVQYLPQDRVCYGFTRLEPGGTDGYMNELGKVGICIECGYLANPKSTQSAIRSAQLFLQALGMLPAVNLVINKKQFYVEAYELYYTKTDSFRLTRSFQDFEVIKANEIIGFDGNEAIISRADQMILFARERSVVGAEAFLLVKKL